MKSGRDGPTNQKREGARLVSAGLGPNVGDEHDVLAADRGEEGARQHVEEHAEDEEGLPRHPPHAAQFEVHAFTVSLTHTLYITYSL